MLMSETNKNKKQIKRHNKVVNTKRQKTPKVTITQTVIKTATIIRIQLQHNLIQIIYLLYRL